MQTLREFDLEHHRLAEESGITHTYTQHIHTHALSVVTHMQTLQEIDLEYQHLATESGVTSWRRVPTLNTNSAFIGDLADAVVEALQQGV